MSSVTGNSFVEQTVTPFKGAEDIEKQQKQCNEDVVDNDKGKLQMKKPLTKKR